MARCWSGFSALCSRLSRNCSTRHCSRAHILVSFSLKKVSLLYESNMILPPVADFGAGLSGENGKGISSTVQETLSIVNHPVSELD